MTITLTSAPPPAAGPAALTGATGAPTTGEGLPAEFANVFSRLVDRFNAFANELPAEAGPGQAAELAQLLSRTAKLKPDAGQDATALASRLTQAQQTQEADPLASRLPLGSAASQLAALQNAKPEAPREDSETPGSLADATADTLAALASFLAPVAVQATPQTNPEASLDGLSLDSGRSRGLPGDIATLKGAALPGEAAGRPAALTPSTTEATPAMLAGPGNGRPNAAMPAIIAAGDSQTAAQTALTTVESLSTQATAALQSAPAQALNAPAVQQAEAAITAPVSDKSWPNALGDKVMWMSKSQVQEAQITLNPPNLGPLQITLNLSGDQQANAQFISPHAEVRQAIQDALPQLRDMLASAGISLGQSSVGSEPSRQHFESFNNNREASRSTQDQAILAGESGQVAPSEPSLIRRGRGMVDLFA